jgi:hypothetical protein
MAITPISAAITASNGWAPRRRSASSRTVPALAASTAGNSGSPVRRLSPRPAPRSSARSVAIATTSAPSHAASATGSTRPVADVLRKAAAADQAELRRLRLNDDRGHVRRHNNPNQLVPELGPRFDVGGEVPGVDVGDSGDERGAEKQPAPRHTLHRADGRRLPTGRCAAWLHHLSDVTARAIRATGVDIFSPP